MLGGRGDCSLRAALILTSAALTVGLAACGTTRPASPTTVAFDAGIPLKPGENPADEQLTGKRRGGTLTAYTSEDVISLDPGESYFVLDYAIDYATQRPLFSYMPDTYSRVSPDMAAFMPTTSNGGITDDGRTLTVHIRADVHFSPPVDRAVTSQDIAYAIERGANPNVGNPYFGAYFGSAATAPLEGAQAPTYRGGPIPGIQTPNSSTIVFHMTKPGAGLLIQALTLPLSAPVPESFAGPLDRHNHTTYGTGYLVATGPYMVRSESTGRIAGVGYEPGKSVTLVRNPNWTPSTDYRPAYLNQIDVDMGGSADVIGERVLKGSDALELDTPAQSIIDQAYDVYPAQVTITPGAAGDYYVALNNAAGPMKNADARRAVWAALNRQAIVTALGGPLFATPMTHFIYPGVIGYEEAGGATGPRTDYNDNITGDLAVAERYMRLAGYPSGKYTGRATIQIVGADSGNWPTVTVIVNRAFRRLGFRTKVRQVDQGDMYGTYCGVPKRQIDACPNVGWVRDFADPQSLLYVPFYGPLITATNNSNWGQVNEPRINAAMARATLAVGPAARARAWAGVDKLLVDEAVAAPETFNNAASIESRNVAGVNALWNSGIWDLSFTSLK